MVFEISGARKTRTNRVRERMEIRSQNLTIFDTTMYTFSTILGSFWPPFSDIFPTCFGLDFSKTPGATPDGESGAPGVPDTDRPWNGPSNFDGLGPWGGTQIHDL